MSNQKKSSGAKKPANQKAPVKGGKVASVPVKGGAATLNKSASDNNAAIIAIAVTLAIVMLIGITAGIIALANRPYDFMKANIGRHLKLDPDSYRNLAVTIQMDEVDEAAVTRAINQTLVTYKDKEPINNGVGDRTGKIDIGDEVYIWYRGYYMEEDRRVEFDGGSNITSTTVEEDRLLEIGSGSFIPGFEEGLVGLTGQDTSNLTVYKSGKVEATDYVYLRMDVIRPDGTAYQQKLVRVDLRHPDLESEYGIGFADKIIGAEVGKTIGTFQAELKDAPVGLSTAMYSNVYVVMRTTGEENPVTVTTHFPVGYSSEQLAGKTAYFEVYISQVVHYHTPDLTDAFVEATLKMDKETLASYEGETPAAKYREYVRAQLMEDYEELKKDRIENAIWEELEKLVEVRSIPRRATRPIYEQYLAEFLQEHQTYQASYGSVSIEQYAAATLSLEEGQTYEDYLWDKAEDIAREKMMCYLIMDKEDIKPSEEENARIIKAAKDEALAYYRDEVYEEEYSRDQFASDEAYEAAIAELERSILEYYGETYFEENAHFDLIMARLVTYVTVNVE